MYQGAKCTGERGWGENSELHQGGIKLKRRKKAKSSFPKVLADIWISKLALSSGIASKMNL
jgi:hypothetical protein